MALPAEARRRWSLTEGGSVDVVDLGDSLLIVPAAHGGVRAKVRGAIDEAGGYTQLARRVGDDEPDLA